MLVTLTSLFYMYYFTDGRNVVLKYKLAPQTKYILKKKKKKRESSNLRGDNSRAIQLLNTSEISVEGSFVS